MPKRPDRVDVARQVCATLAKARLRNLEVEAAIVVSLH